MAEELKLTRLMELHVLKRELQGYRSNVVFAGCDVGKLLEELLVWADALAAATARAESAEAKVARLLARRFPVLDGGMSVPWGLVEPHEQQALDNHSQSLKRLAERGGLSWAELNCVLECRRWRMDEPSDEAAKALVLKRVAEYEAAQWVRENSPPQKKPTDEGGRGEGA